jgi:eukaryotic-like serine/threonine-protein kinase
MSLQIGDRIDGKYEIKRLLGEGGMGAVYEGENTLIHRRVAIKVLHAGVATVEEAVKRFEREAQAAGRIGSDHIVEVLDLGRLSNGDLYMVMEFLKGESLSSRIASRGRLLPREIGAIGMQLLDGLSAAHEAGIIHRDLKPDNVFLIAQSKGRIDFVKILDFGISKFNGLAKDFSMTRTGSVMGTPYYMAPEQARGAKNLDARLDVYAAGVILFEAATGRVPFDGDTFNELLIKIVTEEAPPVRQLAPDLDPGLADIIDRARQKNPDQRFPSAREFRDALAGWLEGATSAVATGATLPLGAAGPAIPGADTALVGGAGLAAREVIPANTAAVLAAPVGATVPFGSPGELPALGNRTGQAWANTQAALPPEEPKKRSGRNAMVAGGAAVVLAALVLVFKLQSDAASSAAQAAATSASVERQFQEAREEASRKLDEERARSRELEAKEEARRVERERAEASAVKERASADEERRREEAKTKVVEAQRQRAAARPPAPSRSSGSTASGRRIRTSL